MQGPVRRSTPIDEIPFLAVARALGDLWSYNAQDDVFVVSPDPDLHVFDLNVLKDRCLVLATDGAWNVLTPDMAIQCVSESEKTNEKHMIDPQVYHKHMFEFFCHLMVISGLVMSRTPKEI